MFIIFLALANSANKKTMWKQIKAEKISLMNIIEMLRDHGKKLRNVVAREC
jgi:hypothetical protein